MKIFKWVRRNPQTILNSVIALFTFILLMMFISNSKQVAENTKITRETAQSTNLITKDLKRVLCEDIPDNQCNLLKAVNQILADHKRQDRFESCLLALSGKPSFTGIDASVIAQCQAVSSTTSPPPPSVKNTSQNTTLSQTPNKNSSTKTPKQQPSNGGGGSSQTYTQCVGSKSGILGTIMGVVSCL